MVSGLFWLMTIPEISFSVTSAMMAVCSGGPQEVQGPVELDGSDGDDVSLGGSVEVSVWSSLCGSDDALLGSPIAELSTDFDGFEQAKITVNGARERNPKCCDIAILHHQNAITPCTIAVWLGNVHNVLRHIDPVPRGIHG
jgi:hypothetical protein